MFAKPNDWEKVSANSVATKIVPDGYVCIIKKVSIGKTKMGKNMLVVSFDIAEGEYTNYYLHVYESENRDDKAWKGVYYCPMEAWDGNGTSKALKSFVTAVEDSNEGWTPSWGENFEAHFEGMLVGLLFGEEEFYGSNGKLYKACKAKYAISVKRARNKDFTLPTIKRADPKTAPLSEQNPVPAVGAVPEGFSELSDDDIPF